MARRRKFRSLGEFGDAFSRWAETEVPEKVAVVKQRTAIDIHGRASQATPVDTGRARAAWMVSKGTPARGVPPEGRHGAPAPPTVGKPDPGESIWVVNNLDYIVPLNNGHSQQAPAAFVEKAVQEAFATFEREVKRGL